MSSKPRPHHRKVQSGIRDQKLIDRGDAAQLPEKKPRIHGKGSAEMSIVEDGEEVDQLSHLSFRRSPLVAPLGIPYCSASVSGAHKALRVGRINDFYTCSDSGRLSDTDTLRRRMEQIAAVQGLGKVSMECSNMLNNMLDVYLKRLIKSCVELVGARSTNEPRRPVAPKQQIRIRSSMACGRVIIIYSCRVLVGRQNLCLNTNCRAWFPCTILKLP